ncbi:c-type cytochrome [Candidatus Venteria ishoeyi]|uniref:Cytochrome subunit of sulfide dehydrogenase n=1 Tax=Candidatus Venteria ishoeyi TaxID=1899563 RepID=A0A1H6FCP4_9GAMM|nr:c-type cytochrome [Candidatus Venteria ishoeyi]SEH07403.1 Cytochrome subunit of sulfide dehydrogenase precursor [Candidatus Venteria ishoeyi]
MMITHFPAYLLLITSSLAAAQQQEANPAAPYVQSQLNICAECHGVDGISANPEIPIIAGLAKKTLQRALFAFQADKRPNLTAQGHAIQAHLLQGSSDLRQREKIQQLSRYYAALGFTPAEQTQAFKQLTPQQMEKGKALHQTYCARCHKKQGRIDNNGVGILAGQWLPYLRHSMSDFQTNKREMPQKMVKRLTAMNEAELDDINAGVKEMDWLELLLLYYAAQAKIPNLSP